MGGIYVCGCKEVHVYRFPHINYPYSSCICSFLQHPYFLFIFKMFFVLVKVFFVIYVIFFTQYKHILATTAVPRKPHEGLHITRSTHKQRFISCVTVMDISYT